MKNWITATVIGILVLVVGIIDASILSSLLGRGEWGLLDTGHKVFFITTIVLVGIAAIVAIAIPLYEKLRQW